MVIDLVSVFYPLCGGSVLVHFLPNLRSIRENRSLWHHAVIDITDSDVVGNAAFIPVFAMVNHSYDRQTMIFDTASLYVITIESHFSFTGPYGDAITADTFMT